MLVCVALAAGAAADWWKGWQRDGCTYNQWPGKRQYSSQLMGIQGSWENACNRKEVLFQGKRWTKPDRCKNAGLGGMWGQIDVDDSSCAPNWGEWKRDDCKYKRWPPARQYSSRLWNIQGSWDNACNTMPVKVAGVERGKPDRCINQGPGIAMWGEVEVQDGSCDPKYNPWKRDGCTYIGYRQWSSQLWDIQGSWEDACNVKPVDINGVQRKADRCVNTGSAMWGEVDVPDSSCRASWGPWKRDACSWKKIGFRQYSSVLKDIPSKETWENTCARTTVDVAGVQKPDTKPDRCINNGMMWGEVDIPDSSCIPSWGSWKNGCTKTGVRTYSSKLNVPDGIDWDYACANTAVVVDTVAGMVNRVKADRCIKNGGMWGEVDVTDWNCRVGTTQDINFKDKATFPTWGFNIGAVLGMLPSPVNLPDTACTADETQFQVCYDQLRNPRPRVRLCTALPIVSLPTGGDIMDVVGALKTVGDIILGQDSTCFYVKPSKTFTANNKTCFVFKRSFCGSLMSVENVSASSCVSRPEYCRLTVNSS